MFSDFPKFSTPVEVPPTCCVQVPGEAACAAGGGARPAQEELAARNDCTGTAAAAVTGGPTKCRPGPRCDGHAHLHTQVFFHTAEAHKHFTN